MNTWKNIKMENLNRPVIAPLNINSLRNKHKSLKLLIKGYVDILVLAETKLDDNFPSQQFFIEGYALPYREDRYEHGGGLMIYIREGIASRELAGCYNNNIKSIKDFLDNLGSLLDFYMSRVDNLIILRDFNFQTNEPAMKDFCDIYNLKNLITEPTGFKNMDNSSSIDLILTNRSKSFLNNQAVETGLSDHHKITVTVLRTFCPKQSPICIKYRDYKLFNSDVFCNVLKQELHKIGILNITYDIFESTFMENLNIYAPMKMKYIRANNAPFVTKLLSKAIMNRSWLKNRFIKGPLHGKRV